MRLRVLSVVIVAAAVAAIIATALSQMQRLQLMAVDERRQYLDRKLGGKLSNEQIDRIASAVSARLEPAGPISEPESEGQPEPYKQPEPDKQPDPEGDEAEEGAADSD